MDYVSNLTTHSAARTMTPIFMYVLGLTDREPPKDGQISLKIVGLSVG